MRIEEAKAGDVKELRELIGREFPYAGITEQKVWDKIDNPFFMILKMAGGKGEMVGFAEFQVMDTENGIARLNGITVRDGFRGKGYSKKLLAGAVKKIRENGYKKIILMVKVKNSTAKKLYKGLGFVKVGTLGKLIDKDKVEEWELSL